MKALTFATVLSTCLLAAGAASAQDASGFAGLLATSVEGMGQTLGEALTAGQSVFVTAHGKAKLPAPLTGSYFINVDGKSHSAAEAARVREEKLTQLRAVSKQFGVEMDLGESRFSLEQDTEAQQRRTQAIIAQNAAHPGLNVPFPTDEPPKIFVARTGVRFREPSSARLAAFLDAIRDTGVDDIRTSASGPLVGIPMFAQSQEILGFGSVEQIDDAIWEAATNDAVRNARKQAEALASAGGRAIGPVRQMLFLTKAVQNGEAVVTIAVRFGFAPKS